MGKEWERKVRCEGFQGAEDIDYSARLPASRPRHQSWTLIRILGSWSTSIIQPVHLVAIAQSAHSPVISHLSCIPRLHSPSRSPRPHDAHLQPQPHHNSGTYQQATFLGSLVSLYHYHWLFTRPPPTRHSQRYLPTSRSTSTSCNPCQIFLLRCCLLCTPPSILLVDSPSTSCPPRRRAVVQSPCTTNIPITHS